MCLVSLIVGTLTGLWVSDVYRVHALECVVLSAVRVSMVADG